MANEKLKQNYKDIANSIRAKTGKNGTIKADEMAAEIDSIETGIEPTGTIDITTNGTHNVAQYGEANVNVPNPSTGTKNITTNGNHDVTAFATAHVAVPGPGGQTTLRENKYTYNVTMYAYAEVKVDMFSAGDMSILDQGWSFDAPNYLLDTALQKWLNNGKGIIGTPLHDRLPGASDYNYIYYISDGYDNTSGKYNLEIRSTDWHTSVAFPLCYLDFNNTNDQATVQFSTGSWLFNYDQPASELREVENLACVLNVLLGGINTQNIKMYGLDYTCKIQVNNFGGGESEFQDWLQNKKLYFYDLNGRCLGEQLLINLYQYGNPDPYYSTFIGLPWQDAGGSSDNNGEYNY